jgi:putative ABC transport system substrate-binding protein
VILRCEAASTPILTFPRQGEGTWNTKDNFLKKKFVLFVLAAMFLAVVELSHAHQAGKILRIDFLDQSTASGMAGLLDEFRQELSKLGWIEGKNLSIEYRFAEQKNERLPELAADLVRLKVDLIVVSSAPPALAAKKATTTIPIVMANVGDPVGGGLVASLARPGAIRRRLR